MNDSRLISKFSVLVTVFTALYAITTVSQAASDTDVLNIEATNVRIKEDKIIITGKAEIRMRVFTPENDNTEATSKFLGRNASWVVIVAEEAKFTVLRPKQGESEWWEKMSVDAANALKRGEKIGRIGFYRPEVTLKRNAVHSISGYGYLYPRRDE